jgi:cell division protein FtsI/penicillin-binding protein 2
VTESRNHRIRRARPVLAFALVAFVAGAVVGADRSGASPAYSLADGFVGAWTHTSYAMMYADLDAASQRAVSVSEFANAFQQALTTATVKHMRITGKPHGLPGNEIAVPVRVQTRLFGALSLQYTLKIVESGASPRVSWSPSLAFPGLRAGETLSSHTALPRRATLLTRDGSVLAESPPGPAPVSLSGEETRDSPLGNEASAVLGAIGPVPAARRQELEAEGVPSDASVGVSGLELALDSRLRGTPGGELLAGKRLLAYTAPRAAVAVRTSVSRPIQSAAVTALGGQLGGIVALDPASGQILAVAGIGLDGLQPPGSTFKMVTVTGVLEAGIANRHTVFPYATYATLDGVKLSNANGEECGGTLELAFAVSCNSVFTPLGVKLGAPRLVATAERYGFNTQPSIEGAAESTLPAASDIQGELDVGSTAIGQGEVLATPLQMATVAATIADEGLRPTPTFLFDSSAAKGTRVVSATVARTVRHLMIGVVRFGTGTSAAIPGVTVAGKTGTAELKSGCTSTPTEASSSETSATSKEGCGESEASNTDAWFAAFAPAVHPKIVVCVLLVKDGAGGATAAPVARQVIEAALHSAH